MRIVPLGHRGGGGDAGGLPSLWRQQTTGAWRRTHGSFDEILARIVRMRISGIKGNDSTGVCAVRDDPLRQGETLASDVDGHLSRLQGHPCCRDGRSDAAAAEVRGFEQMQHPASGLTDVKKKLPLIIKKR